MDSKGKMDIFNNPMVQQAMKAMTPEQKEEYKRIGEYMFSDAFKMQEDKIVTQAESQIEEAFRYVNTALMSGLNPSELSQMEIQVLHDIYGEKWYEKYDLTEDEVPKLAFCVSDKPYIPSKEEIRAKNLAKKQQAKQEKLKDKKEERRIAKKNGQNVKKI